jgi:hypothetical protein
MDLGGTAGGGTALENTAWAGAVAAKSRGANKLKTKRNVLLEHFA